MSTFRIPRQRDAISAFAEDFGTWCDTVGIPMAVATRFQVAFDELLTNAMEHGGTFAASGPLIVHLHADVQQISAEIIDAGPPFDPFAQPPPDTTLSLDEREPGGLGILLVRELIDEVHWHYADGRNCIRLSHRIPSTPETTG